MILIRLLSRLLRHDSAKAPANGQLNQWLQQGYRCQQNGEELQAQEMFQRALQADPASADAHYLLGALLGKRGELQEAGIHLRHAIVARPDFADAHAALGNVFLLQDNTRAASASYKESIRLAPNNAAVHSNLGLIYQSNHQYELALRHFVRAHELEPERPGALKDLAQAWIALEQFDFALSRLNEMLAQRPDHFETLTSLGLVLQKTHRPEEALAVYRRAGGENSSDPELLNSCGIALQELGRLDEAITCFDRAIDLKPDFQLARWHRCLVHLLRHDFARGWPDYEVRKISADQPLRPQFLPQWDGGPLTGRRMLVYAEQGLGDEIMFASCLPQVLAMSEHCTIECSPKLEKLFRRSFPAATLYATAPSREFPPAARDAGIDLQMAMGSLPRYLRRRAADFPQHSGYLRPDTERSKYWRERLADLGPGLKVGVSWQGGTSISRRQVRSLPLAQWLPILRTPGARFVNLQYTDCAAEIAELKSSTGITVNDWPEALDDYDETAALVSALDLVISVCTAVIHLGGALGKPVWVLAPFSPEWRYGIAGEKMPWYPSVRIFRQPEYGRWQPVIDKAAEELGYVTQSRSSPARLF